MIFNLQVANEFYTDVDEKAALAELGFRFRDIDYGAMIEGDPIISINSIDELMDFIHDYGNVIINKNYSGDNFNLMIYNGRVE